MNLRFLLFTAFYLFLNAQSLTAQETVSPDPFSIIYTKELPDLYRSKSFKISKRSSVVARHSPILLYSDRIRSYERSEWTYKPTKLAFVVYKTFQDQDDGGNTLGWIENKDRQVVATISDSFITQYQSPSILFPSFLKDRQVPQVRDDPAFSFVLEDTVVRPGALPYLMDSDRHYQKIRLTHLESQVTVILFATFRDEDDGGNTLGWVEDLNGQLIASIGDSYFDPIP
jgi:hypothetical protein